VYTRSTVYPSPRRPLRTVSLSFVKVRSSCVPGLHGVPPASIPHWKYDVTVAWL